MEKLGGGQKPPEFLSTHPAEQRRIDELQKIMDGVIKNYYKPIGS
jgi:predicted Zn-dependent protease